MRELSKFIRTVCCDAPVFLDEWDSEADITRCSLCGTVKGFRVKVDRFALDMLLFKFAWRLGMFSVTDRLSHFVRNIC